MKGLARTISLSIFLILLFNGFSLKAQSVSLKIENKPLNGVLVQLRETHGLKFSFDDDLLSKYKLSLNLTFESADKAISFIIKDFPLSMEKLDGVYVIYPVVKPNKSQQPANTVIHGVIIDVDSGESLPYSHITHNSINDIADAQGHFSFTSKSDTIFRIQVSYLGYYYLDTTLNNPGEHTLYMYPAVLGIQEVVIKNQAFKISTMSNFNPGEMRLNHQVGSYLPGFADNALYNLLRLQPGVLAAGEQSNDLIIWGSYSGQTEVLFDGLTLFGLKNYNDNIGIVNPYMVKDVKLLKGAYPAEYGGKAGGIVDITGISGSKSKPEFLLSATNMTLNSRLSLPVTKRSSLSAAFRQTYYNLYKNTDLSQSPTSHRMVKNLVDLSVTPDYMFRDVILKYAGHTKSGDTYYIDFLQAKDQFNYLVNFVNAIDRTVNSLADESNSQVGSSMFYGKVWENGNTTDIKISYSDLTNNLLNQTSLETQSMHNTLRRYENIQNRIAKLNAGADHKMQLNTNHTLEMGVNLSNYHITLQEDTIGQTLFLNTSEALSLESYAQDRISFENGVNILAGLRVDAPLYLNRVLVQPRISMNYELSPEFWLKAAWGKYDQYVVQSSVLDDAGNYRYFWSLSNDEDIPIQEAQHFTAGFTYQKSNYSFGVEGYFKKLDGLTRYIYLPNRIDKNVYSGNGISRGVDFLFETKFRKHQAWLAYSLSQTLEKFSYFPIDIYRRAPQDQRHEIKMALLLNFHPFYISTNYVFGSGFPDRSIQVFQRETTDLKYSRWDISAVYRLSLKKFNLHTGISVLNVLNTENIKLQNFVKIPDAQGQSINILAEAVPFTPTLFLIVEF